ATRHAHRVYVGGLSPVANEEAVPSFSSSFPHLFPFKENIPCLIPCAIDQPGPVVTTVVCYTQVVTEDYLRDNMEDMRQE
ncbi:hypothetical protein HID58_037799, partial [Brassica napus]